MGMPSLSVDPVKLESISSLQTRNQERDAPVSSRSSWSAAYLYAWTSCTSL